MRRVFVTAALLALVLVPAAAQKADQNTQQFVTKAAISDMFEVQSSKLALERSKDQKVREFAKMMVNDHTKTSNELKGLVKNTQGIQLPTSMDAEHQKKLDELKSASGAQFEQRYRAMQIEGHQAAVSLFENYARSGEHNELKAWAEKTLPHLKTHLQHAQALPEGGRAPAVSEAPPQGKVQTKQDTAAKKNGAPKRDVSVMAAPGPNHVMASTLRGTRVYGANNENIGDINDLVIDRNGQVAAVIVGVGGFLGIGEKNVAIPYKALEFVADQGGTKGTAGQAQGAKRPDRIVLRGMTREDLNAAPAFSADGRTDERTDSPRRDDRK